MECFEKSWLLKMIDHLKTCFHHHQWPLMSTLKILWCPAKFNFRFPLLLLYAHQSTSNKSSNTNLSGLFTALYQPKRTKLLSPIERVFQKNTFSTHQPYAWESVWKSLSLRAPAVLINSKDIIPPKNYTRIPVWSSLMFDKSLQGLA